MVRGPTRKALLKNFVGGVVLVPSVFGWVVQFRICSLWHAVRFACPLAEINLFTARIAKRARWIRGIPRRTYAAGWTGNGARHKLQKVRSNGISQSIGCGREASALFKKRTLRTYLLALISGTQASDGSTRTRNICAVFPPSIC